MGRYSKVSPAFLHTIRYELSPQAKLEAAQIQGRLQKFFERTYERDKDKKNIGRRRIIEIFVENMPEKLEHCRALTMPGPWWHFERQLNDALAPHMRSLAYFGFEMAKDTFALSVCEMSKRWGRKGVKSTTHPNPLVGCQWAHTFCGKYHLHNMDIFDYLKHKQKLFSLVWLDLTSPITPVLAVGLKSLSKSLSPGYCVISITLMKGREKHAIMEQIKAAGSRIKYVEQIVIQTCGERFVLSDVWEYSDTSPLMQVTFVAEA